MVVVAVPFTLSDRLVWLKETLMPEGEDVCERLTVPENPFRLASVRVVFPDVPAISVSVGLARVML